MKSLCIVFALMGQFQIEELPALLPLQSGTFIVNELSQLKQVESKPHLEFLSAPWCGACQGVKQALGRFDKETLPFTYSIANVDSRGWLGASSIPAWAYNGRVIQYGFSTPENLMKNFRKATQPKQARSVNTVQRLSSDQLREFARTYNGPMRGVRGNNFFGHLQDANHGFLAWQLNGLTQQECARIHGGHHYGYLTTTSIGGK